MLAFPTATSISISHRISTFNYSDRIIVMHNGRISDAGPLNELLQRNDFIALLHRSAEAPAVK
mgnify:FL=1